MMGEFGLRDEEDERLLMGARLARLSGNEERISVSLLSAFLAAIKHARWHYAVSLAEQFQLPTVSACLLFFWAREGCKPKCDLSSSGRVSR
jgi:hypothetical protein